jgi:RNA-directed DNA polymerase
MENRKEKAMMYGLRESDSPIVPEKLPNKEDGKPSSAEGVEGRGLAKRNAKKHPKDRTQRRVALPEKLQRIRQASKKKGDPLTALLHHVYSTETLKEAFYSLKHKSAPGVDKVTWYAYQENLEANLTNLSERLKVGTYRPEPVERHYIPKADGRKRPIGIPVLEDKIAQKAMVLVLNQVYEEEFKNFSYGFRPGRSQHDALDALNVALEKRKINWILDCDIQGFFDHLSHAWLIRFIQHRISDKRIIRLINRWLRAGVLEEGKWLSTEEGTPQGGSISPLLANIYLHYVLDLWIAWWRKHTAQGEVIIVRYADDFVVGFQYNRDAKRFWKELRIRLQKFNLNLNEKKTRLIHFGRYAKRDRAKYGKGRPETFEFLGFTHICGRSLYGNFLVIRQTSAKRMRLKLNELKQLLRYRLNWKVSDIGKWLRSVLFGHYRYYGVPYNWAKLRAFYNELVKLWFWQLKRRNQRTLASLSQILSHLSIRTPCRLTQGRSPVR